MVSIKALQPSSSRQWGVAMLTAAVMGVIFGSAFYKSRVFEPYVIRGTFLFRRFIMLKMFFAAMGVSALCFALVSALKPGVIEETRELWAMGFRPKGVLTAMGGGGYLLGVGMAISGACPGMVLAQIGAGVENSGFTMLGGLLGTFAYTLVEHWIKPGFELRGPKLSEWVFVDKRLGLPFIPLTVGFGIFAVGFAVVLEVIFPWREDISAVVANGSAVGCGLECQAWPATVGGALMGLLQVPALLAMRNFLGSSAAYLVVCSVPTHAVARRLLSDYHGDPAPAAVAGTSKDGAEGAPSHPKPLASVQAHAKPRIVSWWVVIYAVFAVLGSYLNTLRDGSYGEVPGVDFASALVGGFVMLFGSRIASGCTSGLGVSGCPIFMAHAWVAVPAMFAGGITVALVWDQGYGSGFYHGTVGDLNA